MVHGSAPSASRQSGGWTSSVLSLWGSIWGRTNKSRSLGDVWQSSTASRAYARELRSNADGEPVRVAFRNATPLPLIMCWINSRGIPHGFHKIEPCAVALQDNILAESDYMEHTHVGHAFAIASCPSDGDDDEEKPTSLDPYDVIAGYRPARTSMHSSAQDPVHLVTITQKQKFHFCGPWGVRKRHKKNDDDDDDHEFEWRVTVREALYDKSPVDTSKKHYNQEVMGGWPVCLEPDWYCHADEDVKQILESDLQVLCELLPDHARDALQAKNTFLYVNRSQRYGPRGCPVKGSGMCFHPGTEWLVENGMSPKKVECVEMYCAAEYPEERLYWGPAGLLLHEFSHAYHNNCLPDGYENQDIQDCFNHAMEEGLYDCVRVKGSQGPTARAYACTNAMEYFAELSVAFLGGLEKTDEFNKWYPFNRPQLKKHDPRAYQLLKRLWKVDAEE